MKWNNLTQEYIDIKFDSVYYLLSAYINIDVVYFEINYRNDLILHFDSYEVTFW